jgi:mannose-1-phosphate guanylyltransferase
MRDEEKEMKQVYAVIMAGGVGSRFWPASRAKNPKQLLDLTSSGRTMIGATVDRLLPDISPDHIIVVTGEITKDAVADALPTLPRENILAEPTWRNTAPCIGWAAIHVRRRSQDGILAVMPSDHLVADRSGFFNAMKKAVSAAENGVMTTFGIVPDHPETGFGYIETSEEISPGLFAVKRFVEKPDLETAKQYLARGNFLWNSGMFFFSQKRILEEIARQMPNLMTGLDKIDKAIIAGNEAEVVAQVYPTLPSESIDYGIMEGAKEINCVPADFGWSDLGSWEAAYDLSKKDADANALEADTILVNAKGCLVRAPKDKLVAMVGVRDLVVVDTGDSLLICKRDRTQDVKKVVTELKKQGRKLLL